MTCDAGSEEVGICTPVVEALDFHTRFMRPSEPAAGYDFEGRANKSTGRAANRRASPLSSGQAKQPPSSDGHVFRVAAGRSAAAKIGLPSLSSSEGQLLITSRRSAPLMQLLQQQEQQFLHSSPQQEQQHSQPSSVKDGGDKHRHSHHSRHSSRRGIALAAATAAAAVSPLRARAAASTLNAQERLPGCWSLQFSDAQLESRFCSFLSRTNFAHCLLMHLFYATGVELSFVMRSIHKAPPAPARFWSCGEQQAAGAVLPGYPCEGPSGAQVRLGRGSWGWGVGAEKTAG
jgi:hypothetical protein